MYYLNMSTKNKTVLKFLDNIFDVMSKEQNISKEYFNKFTEQFNELIKKNKKPRKINTYSMFTSLYKKQFREEYMKDNPDCDSKEALKKSSERLSKEWNEIKNDPLRIENVIKTYYIFYPEKKQDNIIPPKLSRLPTLQTLHDLPQLE